MSAVPVTAGEPWVPEHLEFEVSEHFVTAWNGASKRTGMVTASLRPRSSGWTDATAIDLEMRLTGPQDRVYRILRAVIGEISK
jgi:hypothetical protein